MICDVTIIDSSPQYVVNGLRWAFVVPKQYTRHVIHQIKAEYSNCPKGDETTIVIRTNKIPTLPLNRSGVPSRVSRVRVRDADR